MVVSCAGGLPRRDVSSKEKAQSELEGDVNDALGTLPCTRKSVPNSVRFSRT
jgi:hypothetical protein